MALRSKAAHSLAEKIETVLKEALSSPSGSGAPKEPKQVVSELTAMLGELEDSQRDLLELQQPGVDEDRLQALQRGIQRYAALARFS